jgi:hypothetical protein
MAHVSRVTSIMPRASIISPSNVQGGPPRGERQRYFPVSACRAAQTFVAHRAPSGSPFVALRVNRAANDTTTAC